MYSMPEELMMCGGAAAGEQSQATQSRVESFWIYFFAYSVQSVSGLTGWLVRMVRLPADVMADGGLVPLFWEIFIIFLLKEKY